MTEIIGHGEKTCYTLLKKHYGEGTSIKTQVPLSNLLTYDWIRDLSERQKKETIDLVVYRKDKKPMAVRVQDKHHTTKRFRNIDDSQARILQWNNIEVYDIWYYECPEIFKDKASDEAYIELLTTIQEKRNINLI